MWELKASPPAIPNIHESRGRVLIDGDTFFVSSNDGELSNLDGSTKFDIRELGDGKYAAVSKTPTVTNISGTYGLEFHTENGIRWDYLKKGTGDVDLASSGEKMDMPRSGDMPGSGWINTGLVRLNSDPDPTTDNVIGSDLRDSTSYFTLDLTPAGFNINGYSMAGRELKDTVLDTLSIGDTKFSPDITFTGKDYNFNGENYISNSNSNSENLLASGKLYVLGRSGSDRNLEPPEDRVPVPEGGGLVMLNELADGEGAWVV